ncbi:MAG: adenylate/guanylate cyclase domain-containing protein [Alphaproteobacteria bacterium]
MADGIRRWLEKLGLGEYAVAFEENRLDLTHLPDLSEDDLRELGVTAMGDRKTLLRALEELEGTRTEATVEDAPQRQPSTAERRQLTVMFCDLVGSTALSDRLDPEDMREVMRAYQDAVAAVITAHDGHVANYLGDGIVTYFGWPRAFEDQAERAVLAGLAAVGAVVSVKTPDGAPLAARVGIATGQVVVGDLSGDVSYQTDAISGRTPNLAARLQELAEPGEVVIEAATRQLVGANFDLADRGHHELKGLPDPVQVWRVRGRSAVESRFEGQHVTGLTPFVGRETEIGLLLDRWGQARGGEGQVLLLSGEAGIGKSESSMFCANASAARPPWCAISAPPITRTARSTLIRRNSNMRLASRRATATMKNSKN